MPAAFFRTGGSRTGFCRRGGVCGPVYRRGRSGLSFLRLGRSRGCLSCMRHGENARLCACFAVGHGGGCTGVAPRMHGGAPERTDCCAGLRPVRCGARIVPRSVGGGRRALVGGMGAEGIGGEVVSTSGVLRAFVGAAPRTSVGAKAHAPGGAERRSAADGAGCSAADGQRDLRFRECAPQGRRSGEGFHVCKRRDGPAGHHPCRNLLFVPSGFVSKRPVPPGGEAAVRIVYEPHKSDPGVFHKVIQIYSNSVDGRHVITVQGCSVDRKER